MLCTRNLGQLRPTRRLDQRTRLARRVVEFIEPGIGVRLQDARIQGKVAARMRAAAITRIMEHGGRCGGTAERAVVAHVGPEAPGDGFRARQHRHRGVVAVDALGREHMRTDQHHKRHQRRRAGADPVGQGRDTQVDALAGKSLALPIEWLMLAELRINDARQQVRAGPAPGDRVKRRRRLRDRVAGSAGEFLPHRLDHLVGPRDRFQRLGDALAQLAELAAAARAAGRRWHHHPLARQMRRQRPTHRLGTRERAHGGRARSRLRRGGLIFCGGGLHLLELHLELVEEFAAALGRGVEPVALEFGDEQLQVRTIASAPAIRASRSRRVARSVSSAAFSASTSSGSRSDASLTSESDHMRP